MSLALDITHLYPILPFNHYLKHTWHGKQPECISYH